MHMGTDATPFLKSRQRNQPIRFFGRYSATQLNMLKNILRKTKGHMFVFYQCPAASMFTLAGQLLGTAWHDTTHMQKQM